MNVSVCIVTYNHKKYISQAVNSVLSQKTNFDFEILLGEDDSTDGTREICIEYAKKYPDKIRLFLRNRKNTIYINNNPTGRYNFIETLKQCKGKYIALLDGDDYWTDEYKLQKQYDFLEKNNDFSGCFHDTYILKKNNLTLWKQYKKQVFTTEDTISNSALFHTSSFFFRSTSLFLPECFTKVASGDMALFSIITKTGKLYRIPEIMSVYRKHESGITNTPAHINKYHQNRIYLMECLNEIHNFKYQKKINSVIKFHKKKIRKNNPLFKPFFIFSDIFQKYVKNFIRIFNTDN